MSDDEESEEDRVARRRAVSVMFRLVAVVLIVAVLVFVGGPMVLNWYGCQQLAPIERVFVRGC